MIKVTVSGADNVKREIEALMAKFDLPTITVGIHEDSQDPPEGQINMATLGAIQHFGNNHIPARRWLDTGFQSGMPDYLAIIEDGIVEAVDGGDMEAVMNQVGAIAVGKVQQFLTQLKSPANAPSTINHKKSSNPLIDEGIMRSSVNFKLQKDKPEEGL